MRPCLGPGPQCPTHTMSDQGSFVAHLKELFAGDGYDAFVSTEADDAIALSGAGLR